MIPRYFLALPIAVALSACSAGTGGTSDASTSPDGGNGGSQDGGDGGAPPAQDGGQDGGTGCTGQVANGLLGTWAATLMAGGDAPGGVTTIPVKTVYRFCGDLASGTYQYTEDGRHTPARDCRRVTDLRGTFTYDGATLALTTRTGFAATRECPDPSGNHQNNVSSPDTRSYSATVSGTKLTLTFPGSSPVTYDRE